MTRLTPKEFYQAAASWGSFVTNGDPGACMYGFDEKGLVQNEEHRKDCLAWIERCRKEVAGEPKKEVDEHNQQFDAMVTYLKTAPVEGAMPELDRFTAAYITAALWSTHDEASESGGDHLDDNYGPEHIAPKTLQRMKDDCAKFQEMYGALLTDDHRLRGLEHAVEDIAGHDFWLTRARHGVGFWDGDWKELTGEILTKAANSFGEFDLYVGDDGRIHGDGGNPDPAPIEGASEPQAAGPNL